MDFIDYRKKLGIGFNDRELENLFFHRIFNVLDGLKEMNNQISANEYFSFCHNTGCKMWHDYTQGQEFNIMLNVLHSKQETIAEFLSYYMAFVNCQKNAKYKVHKKEDFKKIVCRCLENSHIPFEVLKDKDGYFIFPKGAKELDDVLVSEPLEWLNEYPKTRVEFVQALKNYSDLTNDNASDVADKFRKALERFFQEFFGKNGTLENLKKEYGTYVKGKGVPAELSNNLEALLQAYTNFMNGYAKHHSKTNKNLLEYILYQTGNIIRLMITLKKED